MAIRVDEVEAKEEEVFLPGPVAGGDEDGPFEFTYPPMGIIRRAYRRMQNASEAEAVALSDAAMLRWLELGFGEEAWRYIDSRIRDDMDPLDEDHMEKLFQLLVQEKTGRPITSSSGAVRQPWKKQSTAASSPKASTPTGSGQTTSATSSSSG